MANVIAKIELSSTYSSWQDKANGIYLTRKSPKADVLSDMDLEYIKNSILSNLINVIEGEIDLTNYIPQYKSHLKISLDSSWKNNRAIIGVDGVSIKGFDIDNQEYEIRAESFVPGPAGASLEYKWEDTSLGVRVKDEGEFVYTNLKGDTGSQGPQGDIGPQGPVGDAGAHGVKGDKGDIGPQGPKGDKGEKGQGVVIKGVKNSIDELPMIGSEGDAWLVLREIYVWDSVLLSWANGGNYEGPQGLRGEKGDVGLQGLKGDTGEIPAFEIGNVITLEPKREVTVQLRGTKENPILDFGIPRGEDGAGDDIFIGEEAPEDQDACWFDDSDKTNVSFVAALTEEVRTLIGGMRLQITELTARIQALESQPGQSTTSSMLLLEDGYCLLDENGNYLSLE